jgi:acyl-CoA thioesterase-1
VGVILQISRALFLIALITALQQAAHPAIRETSGVRTVLVLGDSLSEGFRLPPGDAWPMLVAEKLHGIDPKFQVINASASGGTTAGGLRRLSTHLGNKVDIFVLELGINDAFRGVPVEQIRQNLQSIIDKVRGRSPNAAIVVVGMQFPIVTNDDDYVTAFGKMFGELSQQNHAVLVPYLLKGVAGDPALNLEDRIHPNAAGHQILAETVWRVLEPVARQVAAK